MTGDEDIVGIETGKSFESQCESGMRIWHASLAILELPRGPDNLIIGCRHAGNIKRDDRKSRPGVGNVFRPIAIAERHAINEVAASWTNQHHRSLSPAVLAGRYIQARPPPFGRESSWKV